MNINYVANILETNVENLKKVKGGFRYHQSYFWGINKDASELIARIKKYIPNAIIIDSGNHWHSFVGSAKEGSAKDSYLWVIFSIPQ